MTLLVTSIVKYHTRITYVSTNLLQCIIGKKKSLTNDRQTPKTCHGKALCEFCRTDKVSLHKRQTGRHCDVIETLQSETYVQLNRMCKCRLDDD